MTTPGPTLSRRRLRTALRHLREENHYTTDDVRKGVEWSLSKVTRIEAGTVTVALADLHMLLRFYGVDDPGEVTRLLDLARSARRRSWAASYREYVSSAYIDFMGYEDEAAVIKHFHPVVIPGLLQCRAYAEALIRLVKILPHDDKEIQARVALRMHRQQRVFDRAGEVELRVIIDELALQRNVGGREVMRDQLAHLSEMFDHPAVEIAIIPFHPDVSERPTWSFSLLEFTSEQDSPVVYLENLPSDVALVENEQEIVSYEELFENLWNSAVNGDTARSILAQQASRYE
ncbi:helix-turn-helix domain-containing protein [Micromonospora sp. LOL_023]|uniref:helix-turn-helix domain-containing protein n=1 Tax=Micromonospora sp. LOL_023 TaxID=3345418 RepID=UPI003A896D23